jgi:hypothetical protein
MSVTSLVCSACIFSICLFGHVAAAPPQSAADQPYSLFGTQAAIMGRGGIYSRMVGHKTVLLNANKTGVVGEAIASPNEQFEAAADLTTKTITVRKTEWHGRWGQQRDSWHMKGYFELLGLADDGEHLVAGTRGVYPLPVNCEKNQVMVSFLKVGRLVGQIRLDQLIRDFSRLEKVASGYRWGRYLGLNRAGYFVVETVEGNRIPFDVRTGKAVTFASDGKASPHDWKVYQDIMRCYEFRYAADYTLEERLGYQETATGETVLRGARTHWTMSTRAEDQYRESAKMSFEEFAIERAKAMHQADGPDGSVYADAVVRKKASKNSHGLDVLQFSLSIVRETFDEDGEETITEETTTEPIYVVSISQPADQRHQALFVQPEPDEGGSQGKKELIEKIVDTVKVLK